MKIIKGNKRLHEYIDNYTKVHDKEEFLIIDDKNSNYKYSRSNLSIFISNEENWENNVKTCLQEKKDRVYILFTNTDYNNENLKYFDEEFNYADKNIIFIFNDNCENIIEDDIFMNEDGFYISEQVKYPVGSFIEWNDKYLRIIENRNDSIGIVDDEEGNINRFYFDFGVKKIKLITDENKIKELNELFSRK
jgi:hypothetical protein